MSGNNEHHDVYARVPRWLWGLLVAAIAWATHVTIQLAALNVRVEQTTNTSDQVRANVKLVTELLITIREHDRQISQLNEKSDEQLERLHRLELQREGRLQDSQCGNWAAVVCMKFRHSETRGGIPMISGRDATDGPPPVVAFGPELPGIGSWNWVGGALAVALEGRFKVLRFRERIPDCDAAVIVKYKPPLEEVINAGTRAAVLFCPIDAYGSAADIDADYRLLRSCRHIIVHAPSLAKYFQSYAPVELLDHHVNYVAPLRTEFRSEGPVLWTGLRSNLPPVVDWLNSHRLPAELQVLTNLEEGEAAAPEAFGFRGPTCVRVERWSAERHRSALATARAAIDVKGGDFRQRHKPPAKAIDCIASGVPLAMNSDSSSVAYLRTLGFEVARPDDPGRWFSEEYWRETRRLGAELRDRLSREGVAGRLAEIVEKALGERAACPA